MKKIMKHMFILILSVISLLLNIQCSIQINHLKYNTPKSSFLQTSTNLQMMDKSGIQEMSRLLLTTSGPRTKKRYTEDGRLCSSAFVQDGQTFFDCTATRSPDGQNKNKEWCYVDVKEKGEKTWDYCKPIMDYDKVRETNQMECKELSIATRKAESEIGENIGPGTAALDELKRTKQGQADLDSKINNLLKDITTLKNNMQNLFNTNDLWSKEEEKAVEAATKIDQKKQKATEDAANNPPTKMDNSEDTIRREMQNDQCSINSFLQEKTRDTSYDCSGKLLYEEDSSGDGLIGQYYDNEFFLGDFKEQRDTFVDFEWTGASPIDGVNPYNFSVRWEGFIIAPFTSGYTFSIECDGGATIAINNKIIVSHNMITGDSENKERVDKWLANESKKRTNASKNYQKATSLPLVLNGGTKYKIVVSYVHSVHTDIMGDNRTFVKLYWGSEEFEETIIPRAYLYTQNSFPPLKISGLPSETAIVRKLVENDLAFKNSDEYIIQDIPLDFRGSSSLKLNSKFLDDKISFYINIAAYVYIGRLDYFPDPLTDDFENTNEFMSLLEIDKSNHSGDPKVINSERSSLIKIFRKKFDAGKVEIKFNKQSINTKGFPLIMFFGFDSSISSPISCGGDELLISKTGSEYYKKCTSSSFFNSDWKCEYGFNNKNRDTGGSMWATRGEGINSWIMVEFNNFYQLTKIDYFNRRNPSERNQEIEIEYSTGVTQTVQLKNIDSVQTFKVDANILSTSVKFTFKKVYGTVNNGGSFRVYGLKCIDPDEEPEPPKSGFFASMVKKVVGLFSPSQIKPLFKIEDKSVITLVCKDNLINNKKFNTVKKKPGNEVEVFCPDSCSSSIYAIYGDQSYSRDSAICKAATHSDQLNSEGGKVKIVFGLGQTNYKSQIKNGIKSKSKGRSDLTMSFKAVKEVDDIILKDGSRVDFKDSSGKWQPGMITKITESKNSKVVAISIEGSEAKPVEISYPNKLRIIPCGEKTKGRDCSNSRRNMSNNNPIKIRFAPKGEKEPGDYLWDRGNVFGKDGPFGWSKDMTSRVKIRVGGNKPLHKFIVEFPPSSKSKFCTRPTPNIICDNVTWSVKAGIGKFNVKVYVGDPQANTRIDLKINDIVLIKQKTIDKADLQVFEGVFDTINEQLTLNSECDFDCDYAMAKINMVEIFPYKEDEEIAEEETSEKADPCGNAYTGGRCDKGPDVENCVFDDISKESAKLCTGNLFLVQVPKDNKCPTQREKFKCVKKNYDNVDDCSKFCPGKCEKTACQG